MMIYMNNYDQSGGDRRGFKKIPGAAGDCGEDVGPGWLCRKMEEEERRLQAHQRHGSRPPDVSKVSDMERMLTDTQCSVQFEVEKRGLGLGPGIGAVGETEEDFSPGWLFRKMEREERRLQALQRQRSQSQGYQNSQSSQSYQSSQTHCLTFQYQI